VKKKDSDLYGKTAEDLRKIRDSIYAQKESTKKKHLLRNGYRRGSRD